MINIKNLSKDYISGNETFRAVKNASFDVEKGEIFGIIGLSGAGKSTLVRCINRLEEPSSGSIIIDNVDITALDKRSLRLERKEIGMIFQHFNLLFQKTVFDNIAFPLQLDGQDKREIEKRVDQLLEYVDLTDKKYAYPSQLSGGQKQRVAIARAIANNPKVLLSDEGTSALDPQTTKSILALLNRIRKELGITIVMITHQMEVVKEICDRVAVMEDGEIVEIDTVENIFKNPKTKTSRSFINTMDTNIEEEIINPESFDGTLIRLSYLGNSSNLPILSETIKNYNVHFNILSGNINKLQATNVGHLILEIIGKDDDVAKAISYLKSENVNVEVIKW